MYALKILVYKILGYLHSPPLMFGRMILHPKLKAKKHYPPSMFEEINISLCLY